MDHPGGAHAAPPARLRHRALRRLQLCATFLFASVWHPFGCRVDDATAGIADYFTVATWLTITAGISAAGGCLFYAAINAFALWFVWRWVPETKGMALEALEAQASAGGAADGGQGVPLEPLAA